LDSKLAEVVLDKDDCCSNKTVHVLPLDALDQAMLFEVDLNDLHDFQMNAGDFNKLIQPAAIKDLFTKKYIPPLLNQDISIWIQCFLL
jgi:hypothetical protein